MFKTKKKIFLTGANGFLGSHIAFKLTQQGYSVVALIRNNKPLSPLLRACPVEYCRGDILNPDSYDIALKKCNMVIHTAAITSFGLRRVQGYYRINVDGTNLLLKYSEKNGIERFIHTSTRGTLGVADIPEQSDETCTSQNIGQNSNDYIKSKYLAEKEVIDCSKKGNMFCIILSPTALIGAYDVKPTPIGQIILSYLRRRVYVYMDGGINVIDAEDAAGAFVAALEKGENGQVYILGNKNITLHGLFSQLSEISNIPAPKIKIPFPLAYAASAVVEKMSNLTRYPPFVTPQKVVSLYRNYSYCNSRKALITFNLLQSPLSHTLRKSVGWFRENFHIK